MRGREVQEKILLSVVSLPLASSLSSSSLSEIEILGVPSLPTTGIIGLAIVAVACVLAGAFIILRRG